MLMSDAQYRNSSACDTGPGANIVDVSHSPEQLCDLILIQKKSNDVRATGCLPPGRRVRRDDGPMHPCCEARWYFVRRRRRVHDRRCLPRWGLHRPEPAGVPDAGRLPRCWRLRSCDGAMHVRGARRRDRVRRRRSVHRRRHVLGRRVRARGAQGVRAAQRLPPTGDLRCGHGAVRVSRRGRRDGVRRWERVYEAGYLPERHLHLGRRRRVRSARRVPPSGRLSEVHRAVLPPAEAERRPVHGRDLPERLVCGRWRRRGRWRHGRQRGRRW